MVSEVDIQRGKISKASRRSKHKHKSKLPFCDIILSKVLLYSDPEMLPVLDILHRGVVLSLVGLSAYGVLMSVAVHRDTIQRGKGTPVLNLNTLFSLF